MREEINTGTTPNDGTGDDLRTAMEKVNNMMTELYGRCSPIAGSVEGIISACKWFQFNTTDKNSLFYVGEIICGEYSAPNYHYSVQIWRTFNPANVGEMVMNYDYVGTSQKTGLMMIPLIDEVDGQFSGTMLINWSALTLGNTYRGDNWAAGGIFAYDVIPAGKSVGDESKSVITADESVVDGSRSLYILNPVAAIDVYACEYSLLLGEINLKNISEFSVTFYGHASETFDSGISVVIEPGSYAKIIPYDGNFLVTGDGLITPAP